MAKRYQLNRREQRAQRVLQRLKPVQRQNYPARSLKNLLIGSLALLCVSKRETLCAPMAPKPKRIMAVKMACCTSSCRHWPISKTI